MASNDCPLCLCPVVSERWGVCVPCGHALHLSCYYDLSVRSSARDMSCPVCKSTCRSFVQVYLDINPNEISEQPNRQLAGHAAPRSSWLSQLRSLFDLHSADHHVHIQDIYQPSMYQSARYQSARYQSIDFTMHEGITTALFALMMTIVIALWVPLRFFLRFVMRYPSADSIVAILFSFMLPLMYIFVASCLNLMKRKRVEVEDVKKWFRDIQTIVTIWSFTSLSAFVTIVITIFWLSSNKIVGLLECYAASFYVYVLICMLKYLGYNSQRQIVQR